MLREVHRALAVAFLFSGAIALLTFALPFYALIALEAALPGGTLETLLAATPMLIVAIAALIGLELVRERVLGRAALWLEHMLGRQVAEKGLAGGRSPLDTHTDARALTTVAQAMKGPLVRHLLDLPWLPLPVAAVIMIHPLLGSLAAGAVVLTALLAILAHRLTGEARADSQIAETEADAWLREQAVAASDADPREAAAKWERLHRAHVASAYVAGRRLAFAAVPARLVLHICELAGWGLSAWLVMNGRLSVVGMVIAGLVAHRIFAKLEAAAASVGELAVLHDAHTRLAALPTDTPAAAQQAAPAAAPASTMVRGHAPGHSPIRLVAIGGRTIGGGHA